MISRNIGLRGGVAPVRRYIPELLDDVLEGRIQPGRVFDFETDLNGIAAPRRHTHQAGDDLGRPPRRRPPRPIREWAQRQVVRGAQVLSQGHINAGGIDKDVTFVNAGSHVDDDLDARYRAKYRHYPANIVGSIITAAARSTTLKLVPR